MLRHLFQLRIETSHFDFISSKIKLLFKLLDPPNYTPSLFTSLELQLLLALLSLQNSLLFRFVFLDQKFQLLTRNVPFDLVVHRIVRFKMEIGAGLCS